MRLPLGSADNAIPSDGKLAELEMRLNSQDRHIEHLEDKLKLYKEQVKLIQESPP